MGLSGQKILGVPIIVQPTLAEKNRVANAESANSKGLPGPMRLYVGSLHFNITEDMLRSIFEPFGKIDHIQLIMDTETGRSKGYGFITVSWERATFEAKIAICIHISQAKRLLGTIGNHFLWNIWMPSFFPELRKFFLFYKYESLHFYLSVQRTFVFLARFQFHNSEDAKKALEQLNGFELAGRPMKVNHVTERSETQQGSSVLDSDEMERAGIDLGKRPLLPFLKFVILKAILPNWGSRGEGRKVVVHSVGHDHPVQHRVW